MVRVGPPLHDEGRREGDVERRAVVLGDGGGQLDGVPRRQSGLADGVSDVQLVQPLVGPGHLALAPQDVEVVGVDLREGERLFVGWLVA